MSQSMDCRALVELVNDYIEGSLAPADHRRFEEHLAACPFCARYLEQMRKTIALTGHLQERNIEPEARERLLAAFRNWRMRTA